MSQTQQKKMAIAASLYTPEAHPLEYVRNHWAYEYRTLYWPALRGEGGIYMFAKATGKTMTFEHEDGSCHVPLWHAIYVGETHDLGEDLPRHPQWQKAEELGARHVIFDIYHNEGYRESVAEDWKAHFTPPLNTPDPDFPPEASGTINYAMMLA